MNLENAVCFSNIDQPESWKIQTYMSSGGYLTWKKILQGQPGALSFFLFFLLILKKTDLFHLLPSSYAILDLRVASSY